MRRGRHEYCDKKFRMLNKYLTGKKQVKCEHLEVRKTLIKKDRNSKQSYKNTTKQKKGKQANSKKISINEHM
jgi:hypothetical protein